MSASEEQREKQRGYDRAYYERHKDRIRKRKAEQMRVRRINFKDTFRQQGLNYRQATRERLFFMYGKTCAICGFDDVRALTLDHIHGDGNEERRKVGEKGVYRLALQDHAPDLYRILCMNCQFIEYKEMPSERRSPGESLVGRQ